MRLEHIADVIDFDPFETRTEAEATHALGEAVVLADRRIFRHTVAGAAALGVGKCSQAAVPIAAHANVSVAAAAIGATLVNVTPGATAGAANLYSEGYLNVNDGTGQGYTYKIKDHLAITASTAFDVNLYDPIKVALVASGTSEVTLVHNGYKNVVEGTGFTARAAGVPLVAIGIGDYGWLQTKGLASVLCGTSGSTLGADQILGTPAGSITDRTDSLGASAEPVVAVCDIVVGVATEYNAYTLRID